MALAYSLRIDFVDNKNKPSFTKIKFPSGGTINQITEFCGLVLAAVNDLSDCRITKASVNVAIDLSGLGLKAVANALADRAKKVFFNFNTSVGGFRAKQFLPTLDESKVVAGSSDIDLADLDVAAYVLANTAGLSVTGGTINVVDGRGNDISGIAYAEEQFRDI